MAESTGTPKNHAGLHYAAFLRGQSFAIMNELHSLTQAIIVGKRKEVPDLINQCLAAGATIALAGRTESALYPEPSEAG